MSFNYMHIALGLLGAAAAVTCGEMMARRRRPRRIEALARAPRRLAARGPLSQLRR